MNSQEHGNSRRYRLNVQIILVLTIATTALTVWAWIDNSYQSNFAVTKSSRLTHETSKFIQSSADIDSVRQKALETIDNLDNRNSERELALVKVQNRLFVAILLNFASLAFLFNHIRKGSTITKT